MPRNISQNLNNRTNRLTGNSYRKQWCSWPFGLKRDYKFTKYAKKLKKFVNINFKFFCLEIFWRVSMGRVKAGVKKRNISIAWLDRSLSPFDSHANRIFYLEDAFLSRRWYAQYKLSSLLWFFASIWQKFTLFTSRIFLFGLSNVWRCHGRK